MGGEGKRRARCSKRKRCESKRASFIAVVACTMQIEQNEFVFIFRVCLLVFSDNAVSPLLTSANKFDNRVQRVCLCVCVRECLFVCMCVCADEQINNYFECTFILYSYYMP